MAKKPPTRPPPPSGSVLDAIEALEARRGKRKAAPAKTPKGKPEAGLDLDFIR